MTTKPTTSIALEALPDRVSQHDYESTHNTQQSQHFEPQTNQNVDFNQHSYPNLRQSLSIQQPQSLHGHTAHLLSLQQPSSLLTTQQQPSLLVLQQTIQQQFSWQWFIMELIRFFPVAPNQGPTSSLYNLPHPIQFIQLQQLLIQQQQQIFILQQQQLQQQQQQLTQIQSNQTDGTNNLIYITTNNSTDFSNRRPSTHRPSHSHSQVHTTPQQQQQLFLQQQNQQNQQQSNPQQSIQPYPDETIYSNDYNNNSNPHQQRQLQLQIPHLSQQLSHSQLQPHQSTTTTTHSSSQQLLPPMLSLPIDNNPLLADSSIALALLEAISFSHRLHELKKSQPYLYAQIRLYESSLKDLYLRYDITIDTPSRLELNLTLLELVKDALPPPPPPITPFIEIDDSDIDDNNEQQVRERHAYERDGDQHDTNNNINQNGISQKQNNHNHNDNDNNGDDNNNNDNDNKNNKRITFKDIDSSTTNNNNNNKDDDTNTTTTKKSSSTPTTPKKSHKPKYHSISSTRSQQPPTTNDTFRNISDEDFITMTESVSEKYSTLHFLSNRSAYKIQHKMLNDDFKSYTHHGHSTEHIDSQGKPQELMILERDYVYTEKNLYEEGTAYKIKWAKHCAGSVLRGLITPARWFRYRRDNRLDKLIDYIHNDGNNFFLPQPDGTTTTGTTTILPPTSPTSPIINNNNNTTTLVTTNNTTVLTNNNNNNNIPTPTTNTTPPEHHRNLPPILQRLYNKIHQQQQHQRQLQQDLTLPYKVTNMFHFNGDRIAESGFFYNKVQFIRGSRSGHELDDDDLCSMVFAADWATGCYNAHAVGHAMRFEHGPFRQNDDGIEYFTSPIHHMIHGGDIYYTGTKEEVHNNFLGGEEYCARHSVSLRKRLIASLRSYPKKPKPETVLVKDRKGRDRLNFPHGTIGRWTTCGNHEMLTGGHAFKKCILPSMGVFTVPTNILPRFPQYQSFFTLENKYWRVVCLDSGYYSGAFGHPGLCYTHPDGNNCHCKRHIRKQLPQDLCDWLDNTVRLSADNRGLVFISHHMHTSAIEISYRYLLKQIESRIGTTTLNGTERTIIWLAGDEHLTAIYHPFQQPEPIIPGQDYSHNSYLFCAGATGMPARLFEDHIINPQLNERGLALYDGRIAYTRSYTKGGSFNVGHPSFLRLDFDKEELTIRVRSLNSVPDTNLDRINGSCHRFVIDDAYDIAKYVFRVDITTGILTTTQEPWHKDEVRLLSINPAPRRIFTSMEEFSPYIAKLMLKCPQHPILPKYVNVTELLYPLEVREDFYQFLLLVSQLPENQLTSGNGTIINTTTPHDINNPVQRPNSPTQLTKQRSLRRKLKLRAKRKKLKKLKKLKKQRKLEEKLLALQLSHNLPLGQLQLHPDYNTTNINTNNNNISNSIIFSTDCVNTNQTIHQSPVESHFSVQPLFVPQTSMNDHQQLTPRSANIPHRLSHHQQSPPTPSSRGVTPTFSSRAHIHTLQPSQYQLLQQHTTNTNNINLSKQSQSLLVLPSQSHDVPTLTLANTLPLDPSLSSTLLLTDACFSSQPFHTNDLHSQHDHLQQQYHSVPSPNHAGQIDNMNNSNNNNNNQSTPQPTLSSHQPQQLLLVQPQLTQSRSQQQQQYQQQQQLFLQQQQNQQIQQPYQRTIRKDSYPQAHSLQTLQSQSQQQLSGSTNVYQYQHSRKDSFPHAQTLHALQHEQEQRRASQSMLSQEQRRSSQSQLLFQPPSLEIQLSQHNPSILVPVLVNQLDLSSTSTDDSDITLTTSSDDSDNNNIDDDLISKPANIDGLIDGDDDDDEDDDSTTTTDEDLPKYYFNSPQDFDHYLTRLYSLFPYGGLRLYSSLEFPMEVSEAFNNMLDNIPQYIDQNATPFHQFLHRYEMDKLQYKQQQKLLTTLQPIQNEYTTTPILHPSTLNGHNNGGQHQTYLNHRGSISSKNSNLQQNKQLHLYHQQQQQLNNNNHNNQHSQQQNNINNQPQPHSISTGSGSGGAINGLHAQQPSSLSSLQNPLTSTLHGSSTELHRVNSNSQNFNHNNNNNMNQQQDYHNRRHNSMLSLDIASSHNYTNNNTSNTPSQTRKKQQQRPKY